MRKPYLTTKDLKGMDDRGMDQRMNQHMDQHMDQIRLRIPGKCFWSWCRPKWGPALIFTNKPMFEFQAAGS